jgi:ABC-type uncharacterized transport system fused permease/ATPase subunit
VTRLRTLVRDSWIIARPSVHRGGIAITIPGYLVWAALLYAILGTWLTIVSDARSSG